MGVPKGLMMAANSGKLGVRGPMAGSLKQVPGGRRIGPAGPGTGSPGRRKMGGGFHKSAISAFGVDHGGQGA